MAESLRWCITVGHTTFIGRSALKRLVACRNTTTELLWIDLSSLKQAQKLISPVPEMNVFIAFTTGNPELIVRSMGLRNRQPTSHCRAVSNGVDRVDLPSGSTESLPMPIPGEAINVWLPYSCRPRPLQSSVNLRRRDEGTVGFDKPALIASGTTNDVEARCLEAFGSTVVSSQATTGVVQHWGE